MNMSKIYKISFGDKWRKIPEIKQGWRGRKGDRNENAQGEKTEPPEMMKFKHILEEMKKAILEKDVPGERG